MNKENFDKKLKEFDELIRQEKKKIDDIKNNIYKLENERQIFENTCNHKYDDGTSAMKSSGYYVTTNVSTSINDWTGEEEEHVEGYTQYEETCKICGFNYET